MALRAVSVRVRRACFVSPRRWVSSGCSSEASPRALAEAEDAVLDALRKVPWAGREAKVNVVTSGIVKDLQVDLKKGSIKLALLSGDGVTLGRCMQAIENAGLSWLKSAPLIEARATQETQNKPHSRASSPASSSTTGRVATADGLEGVRQIIAVSSCKGGVGKSTVAVNLACALSERFGPKRVGLLDTDIYGPSLPTMMCNDNWAVTRSSDKRMINPVVMHGIKCMSYGFVAPGTGGQGKKPTGPSQGLASAGGAAVLRGPIVSQIVQQLATQTEWGELDYLVVDMPPGTGDIAISLGQQLRISGAVIVTTPQRLAYVDVVKGLEMFENLKVPTLCVVENMTWFDGDDGKRYKPFGPGHREALLENFGIESSFSLPIMSQLSESGDSGTPFFVAHPSSPLAAVYREIAESVATARKVQDASYLVRFVKERNVLVLQCISKAHATSYEIAPVELRRRMRKTEDMMSTPNRVDDLVYPAAIQPMGNYAVSIKWSDGHDASIYPYKDILQVCEQINKQGA